MLYLLHRTLIVAYVVAPIAALVVSILQVRRSVVAGESHAGGRRHGRFAFTVSSAIVLGTAFVLAYSVALGGRASIGQVVLAIYFTAAMLFLLAALDSLLVIVLKRAWAVLHRDGPGVSLWRRLLEPVPLALRAVVMVFIALPYVMAVMLTYRPKVVTRETPMSALEVGFEAVRFDASDGTTLAGWWIPAAQGRPIPRSLARRSFGADTVVVCHGFSAGKVQALPLVRDLLVNGYNVLLFDFRAHGESGGQLVGLGALERTDVLAAVQWLKRERPDHSRRVLGVGIGTGGAALISAAGDGSGHGQSIEALAVIGTYDDASSVARTIARRRFLPPVNWIADRVTLALASLQVGEDLVHFAPAAVIGQVWPRPVLVIHGVRDGIVPFDHGRKLFDAAAEPKRCLWLSNVDHIEALSDPETVRTLLEFFGDARPVPVI